MVCVEPGPPLPLGGYVVTLTISAIIVVAIAAGGGGSDDTDAAPSNDNGATTEAAANQEESLPGLNDAVRNGKFEFTITDVQRGVTGSATVSSERRPKVPSPS